jgi:hypothetical protein
MDVGADEHVEVSPMSSIALAPGYATPRPGRAGRAGSGQSAPLRLTRRGRLVVLAVLLAAAFLAVSMVGGRSAATGEAGQPVETRTVVVGEGDTLWGIASTVAEPGEVRETIHYLQELNALPDASLSVGQELAVPVG